MSEIVANSPNDIQIVSVLVESERLDTAFEIALNVVEINIYEHIDLPVVTASILIADSSNIFELVNFQGAERITIKLKLYGDPRAVEVEKVFVTNKIENSVPINDMGETILISLIEDHGYLDKMSVISKAYSGKPEKIIETILKDRLDKDVSTPKTLGENPNWTGSIQAPMKIVIPNWNALRAVRWLKDRAHTRDGLPLFVYSTLFDDKIVVTDLESIMNPEKIINKDQKYVYSQAYNRQSSTKSVEEQSYNIQQYVISGDYENTLKLGEAGGISSNYSFIDLNSSEPESTTNVDVRIDDIFENMVNKNIISQTQSGKSYDDEFVIGNKKLLEYSPSVITQIVSGGTYDEFSNYYEDFGLDQHRLKGVSNSVRQNLVKSPINISVPGWNFLGRDTHKTIGNQIDLFFLKNDPNITEQASITTAEDKKKSGVYVIYAARHTITRERYDITMTCTKIGNKVYE